MATIMLQLDDEQRECVRSALQKVLQSAPFQHSTRRQKFLEFIVEEALAGRGDRLKGYTIALAVFDRPPGFDMAADPIVRVEAGRLRDKLREYYEDEGRNEAIRFELPKGNYAPKIEFAQAQAADPKSVIIKSAVIKSGPLQPEKLTEDDPILASAMHERFVLISLLQRSALAKLKPTQAGLLAGAIVLILVVGFWGLRGGHPGATLPEKPSIAVLPFDNIGNDTQWERFADGMTEDIITDLAHFRNLHIIARNSTAVYKQKPLDVRQIGRDLSVKYVLEGSIQPIGERIRVTAQLIEATSGSHVWSERYDRRVDDLFTVQNEVTQRIAATLGGYGGAIAEAERRIIKRKPPASLTAFDTYLMGIEAKHKVTKDGLMEAERLFRKALELDPQLARAHVALVDVQFYLIDLGLAPSVEEAVAKMMTSADMAVKLDPNDGKAHSSLGLANLYKGNQEQAAAEFVRAETLAPSDADMLLCIAWSMPLLGQSERGVLLAERALALNPHYPDWYNQGLSYVYFFGKQFDNAVKYRMLVKAPLALDYAFLAMAHAYLDRAEDTAKAAANVTKLNPAWNAELYLSEGGGYREAEAELFVEGARKAGLSDCVAMDRLKDMPNLIPVTSCDRRRGEL